MTRCGFVISENREQILMIDNIFHLSEGGVAPQSKVAWHYAEFVNITSVQTVVSSNSMIHNFVFGISEFWL